MGKRKLHTSSFYQCDWTGFPMKQAYCYMPGRVKGKLTRRGSYCNWESVIAHAAELLSTGAMMESEHDVVVQHVHDVVGTYVECGPHYTLLEHMKGTMDELNYHDACVGPVGPLVCVKIPADGCGWDRHANVSSVPYEVHIPGKGTTYSFEEFMRDAPFGVETGLQSFVVTRKKGSKHDRDLTVWYFGNADLPVNTTASSLFKIQLYGDVIVAQTSREASFIPRKRYLPYNLAMFEDHFHRKKRKAVPEPHSVTPEMYETMRNEMQATFNSFERAVAATAFNPKSTAKVASVAQCSGVSLAAKLKERGVVPPTRPGL